MGVTSAVLAAALSVLVLSVVAAQEEEDLRLFREIYSSEHFDELVFSATKPEIAVNTVLILYKKKCPPKANVDLLPALHNMLVLTHDLEAEDHSWYSKGGTLKQRYANNSFSCLNAMFFKKGESIDSEPLMWDKAEDPELEWWVWQQCKVIITFKSTMDKTLGITQVGWDHSPKCKYEYLFPDETLELTSYLGYSIFIKTVDKQEGVIDMVARKEEEVIVEDDMLASNIGEQILNEGERQRDWIAQLRMTAMRVLTNQKQPLFIKNITADGFKTKEIPSAIYRAIKNMYDDERGQRFDDKFNRFDFITYMNKEVIRPSFVLLKEDLLKKISTVMTELVEKWTNCSMEHVNTYGVHEAHKGSVMFPHVSSIAKPIIAILHIDQEPEKSSNWVFELLGYDGKKHYVTTMPGEMILIEAAKIIHGRPKPFKGQHMAYLELHFRPTEDWPYDVREMILVNTKTEQIEPLYEQKSEFTKNKKSMFSVKDEL